MLAQTGHAAILEAATSGNDEIVMLLLKHGADPNLTSFTRNNSALLFATKMCTYTTVKALLDAGADPWHTSEVC